MWQNPYCQIASTPPAARSVTKLYPALIRNNLNGRFSKITGFNMTVAWNPTQTKNPMINPSINAAASRVKTNIASTNTDTSATTNIIAYALAAPAFTDSSVTPVNCIQSFWKRGPYHSAPTSL